MACSLPPHNAMWNRQTLFAWAHELGFAEAALCRADAFDDVRAAVSQQPVIRERNQLRFDPLAEYREAKSLAVLLWPYRPAPIPQRREVFIDSYYDASNAAYHAAQELESRAVAAGGFLRANVPYPAREAAVRAGMGIIGKNGLLITPSYGTRVVIILLATDLPFTQADKKPNKATPDGNSLHEEKTGCSACGRCKKACPVNAIDMEGPNHPERCLRNFMMEGVVVPEDAREKMGMRLIGCDICQRICPMQPDLSCDAHAPVLLDDFVTLDEEAFSQNIKHLAERIGRNTARPQRVRAQAALLAGILCDPAYQPILERWAQSPFEAVREHALWALERIRGH